MAMTTRTIVRRAAALPLEVKGLAMHGLAADSRALQLRKDGWFVRIAVSLPEESGEP